MIFLRPTRYVEDDFSVPAIINDAVGKRRISGLTLVRAAMSPAQLRAGLDKAVDPHCLENYYRLYPGRRASRQPRRDF